MTALKQDRFEHAITRLEGAHGRMDLQPGDAIDQVQWMILVRHGSRERANRAFGALRAFFVDINELRVAKATDIADLIRAHVDGDPVLVAERLRGFLRKVYDDYNVLGFSFGKNMDREALRKYLASLPDFGPELGLAVLLKLRDDENELIADPHAARVAVRAGLVPSGTAPSRFKKILEEEVPDRAAAIRALLLLALHGGTVCHAKNPACAECALGNWCPSYAAPKKKEAAEPKGEGKKAARHGGKEATPRTVRERSRAAAARKSSRR